MTKTSTSMAPLPKSETARITKRIGATDYVVAIRFDKNAKEKLEQKLLRLIESEVRKLA